MTAPIVLVIDDEPPIRKFLKIALEAEGFDVCTADNARDGLAEAVRRQPAMVILDLGLPDRDGQDVVADLREWFSNPIIVLSVRAGDADKIAALDNGADDYVVKPFSTGELLARIRVALRRSGESNVGEAKLMVGDLLIDVPGHEASLAGVPLSLTRKEFSVLLMLARNAGRIVTHTQILSEVWGPAHISDTHYLRIIIGQLRRKLDDDPASPRFIQNEPGVGYRFIG